MSKDHVIIVAGGTGSRMRSDIPKQFLKIKGTPIIVLSVQQFLRYDPHIQVVIAVHKDFKKHLEKLLASCFPKNNIQIVLGGETRFHSVKNALDLVPASNAVVGIHDAARPFVAVNVIKNCYDLAAKKGNAIPAITLFESIRQVNDKGNKAVDRNQFKVIQTPQCFKIKLIKKAFTKKYSTKFTDDATVLESIGEKINLVEGNFENIKITNPNDLLIAKAYSKHDK